MYCKHNRSLTRCYGTLTAVDGLTISVGAGEVFGLLGPDGAGKMTVIKMLCTLLPPTSGTVRVVGFDICTQAVDVRHAIGYVPQMLSADGALTGYENLIVFAKLYDVPRGEREKQVREFPGVHGLVESADKHSNFGISDK
ncbi:MAG: ATP-binding cassette domain-containing protein [Acidobacteria bacterium]|nr:ATP-binding cassette domain-containing protein [Acidobacteriota bacterium]